MCHLPATSSLNTDTTALNPKLLNRIIIQRICNISNAFLKLTNTIAIVLPHNGAAVLDEHKVDN